jgi:hypothetical protein
MEDSDGSVWPGGWGRASEKRSSINLAGPTDIRYRPV